MKRKIVFGRWLSLGIACGLALSSVAAMAQGAHRGRMADGAREARAERVERRTERPASAEKPQSASGDAAEASKEGGRLSPEERRQLRRDVRQAGRDLYPDRPRRRE